MGRRAGAFSLRQAEAAQDLKVRPQGGGGALLGTESFDTDLVRGSRGARAVEARHQSDQDELLRLRAALAGQRWRQDLDDDADDKEERDESGFYPESVPLVYVPETEVGREDGVEHEVVYHRIAIRKLPSCQARVFGAACRGERLLLFEWDASRTWRKMHFQLRGGWGGIVEAWVMIRHPDLGTLVRAVHEPVLAQPGEAACPCGHIFRLQDAFCSACGKPRPVEVQLEEAPPPSPRARLPPPQPRGFHAGVNLTPALSYALVADGNLAPLSALDLTYAALEEANEGPMDEEAQWVDGCKRVNLEELQLHASDGGEQYEVMYKPFIAIRTIPSLEGKIVGTALFRQRLDTFGWDESGKWRRVFGRLGGSGRCVAGWVLIRHPDVGSLLQPVQDADEA